MGNEVNYWELLYDALTEMTKPKKEILEEIGLDIDTIFDFFIDQQWLDSLLELHKKYVGATEDLIRDDLMNYLNNETKLQILKDEEILDDEIMRAVEKLNEAKVKKILSKYFAEKLHQKT